MENMMEIINFREIKLSKFVLTHGINPLNTNVGYSGKAMPCPVCQCRLYSTTNRLQKSTKFSAQDIISFAANCIEMNYNKDNIKSNSKKQAVVWTSKTISILLKIYEDNLMMLKTSKNKTRIWIAISKCLKLYNLQVTPDQVRWKIDALTKRYKRCLIGEQHEGFKYFKEMDKIYTQFNVAAAKTIAGLPQKEQSYNSRLISKFNLKKCQESIIQLRKTRLANRIESGRSQNKIHLEKQWHEYLKREDEHKLSKDKNLEKNVKVKEEELELSKQTFKINESLEYRKMQMWERKHETLLCIEREKFEMLKKMTSLQK